MLYHYFFKDYILILVLLKKCYENIVVVALLLKLSFLIFCQSLKQYFGYCQRVSPRSNQVGDQPENSVQG